MVILLYIWMLFSSFQNDFTFFFFQSQWETLFQKTWWVAPEEQHLHSKTLSQETPKKEGAGSPAGLVEHLPMFCALHGSRNWPHWGGGGRKNWQQLTENLGLVIWALGEKSHIILQAQCVYCIQMNKEAGLLQTDEQGFRIILYSWTKRQA